MRLLAIFVFVLVRTTCVAAAHSHAAARPRVRQTRVYDRSITTFSPEGRLRQVEYAWEAAGRGSPLVALTYRDSLYVGVLVSGSDQKDDDGRTATSTTTSPHVHRLAADALLLATGVGGDVAALARALRAQALQAPRLTGCKPSLAALATAAAARQHGLTQQPGRRPLGCTAWIVGLDDDDEDDEDAGSSTSRTRTAVRLYQCQPGGSLEDCRYATAGRNHAAALARLDKLYPTLSSPAGVVRALTAALVLGDDDSEDRLEIWILRPGVSGLSLTCLQNVTATVEEEDLQEALAQALAQD